MKKIHGDSETRSQNGETESHIHLHAGETESAHADLDELASQARRRLDELTERATGFAGRIRDTARDRLEGAGSRMEAPAGLIEFVRSRPLTALGAAFAVGLFAGFAGSPENHHWAVERARRRARRLILGGLTAAIAHEFRSAIGDGPIGQIFAALDPDDRDDDEDFDSEDLEELEDFDEDGYDA